jgi:hypothetical protein
MSTKSSKRLLIVILIPQVMVRRDGLNKKNHDDIDSGDLGVLLWL